MFKIITKGYNCEQYAKDCIESVMVQSVSNWQMYIVLDNCTDKTLEICQKYQSDKIIIFNEIERKYSTQNIWNTVYKCNAKDEDILVFIDLDDKLKHNRVLQIIQDNYHCNKDILITYGNFETIKGEISHLKGYNQLDFNKGIRKILLTNWQASHLKTMKFKLWKYIKQKSFRSAKGKWLKHCDDMAFMVAGLEIAGLDRSRFIKEVLYIYNNENPLLTVKSDPNGLDDCCIEVHLQKEYDQMGEII